MNNVLVKCFEGIGDNIYTLPFVKILAKSNQVYIKTPLPKIFKDVPNIKFIKFDDITYRTQQKSLIDDDTIYSILPKNIYKTYTPQYAGKELLENSIVGSFYKQFDIPYHTTIEWKLPSFKSELGNFLNKIPKNRKIAIIRPATIRKEWRVSTRNANSNYIAWCCKILNEAGYYTIAIADLSAGEEWLADNIDVPAELKLYKGELGIYGTLELLKHAEIVIGGSGFCIPATVSSDTNLFLILGGRLLYDGISKTLHPSMNLNKIGIAYPDLPCKCSLNEHNCNKSISTLDVDFFNFLRTVNDNTQ
jgi:ADP-heptose:LPS heptosyltransferase